MQSAIVLEIFRVVRRCDKAVRYIVNTVLVDKIKELAKLGGRVPQERDPSGAINLVEGVNLGVIHHLEVVPCKTTTVCEPFHDVVWRGTGQIEFADSFEYVLKLGIEGTGQHSSSVIVAIIVVDRVLFFVGLALLVSVLLVEVKRILCASSVAQYDPGLVLLFSPLVAAVAAAAAVVVPVVVVVAGGLVLLLASQVTRLFSVVGGMVVASSSTACLLRWLCVFRWASPGINQINEMRIRIRSLVGSIVGQIKNWPGIIGIPGVVSSRGL